MAQLSGGRISSLHFGGLIPREIVFRRMHHYRVTYHAITVYTREYRALWGEPELCMTTCMND